MISLSPDNEKKSSLSVFLWAESYHKDCLYYIMNRKKELNLHNSYLMDELNLILIRI